MGCSRTFHDSEDRAILETPKLLENYDIQPRTMMEILSIIELPSGKLRFCYSKSPSRIGNSPINGPCSIAMSN